jgi:hypothetical protein
MTPERADKRVSLLQYVNTFLLTLTLGVATMTASVLVGVKSEQTSAKVELVRLKTVQDANTNKIGELDTRVDRLEINYVEDLKNWIEQNYIRKPQSK